MSFILAKKIGMTQRFRDNGTVVPVTLVEAGPCVVTQIKTADKDGYTAVQLGFGLAKHQTKARAGHLKDLAKSSSLKEFHVEDAKDLERGKVIDATTFAIGNIVRVTGMAKGKGFQGVVRRHHFRGGPASHGHKDNLTAALLVYAIYSGYQWWRNSQAAYNSKPRIYRRSSNAGQYKSRMQRKHSVLLNTS